MRATVMTGLMCLLLGMVLIAGVWGQGEFVDYPEFRYTSALPGGGWGVTPNGSPGFEGAIQTNVPVAYTPYEGYIVGYASGSFDSSVQIGFSGNDVNGTATIALGLGKPGHGIYLCEMGTSNTWEPVEHVQWQVVPASEDRPAVAIGVVDAFSQRSRDLARTRRGGTVSWYAVATQQFGSDEHPIYATAGAGFRRFNGLFGGLSYRAHDKITVSAEYDGWNMNAGAAFDLSDWLTDDVILAVSLVDMERPVVGLTYVYNK